ncbi:hypothetical protein MUK42_34952 [Musa troglodytarum]|uniref:Uncharacterized protein n=1 Tax=Musa troglodytarum TaxID=320322 RepID=A0A9E7K4B1_9LILI|nr:hypothetical protein MUK42_34952 [Musa troglodytarum]
MQQKSSVSEIESKANLARCSGFKDYSKAMTPLLNGQAMFHDEVSNPESDIQSQLSHALGCPNLDQQQRSQSCFSNREHFY